MRLIIVLCVVVAVASGAVLPPVIQYESGPAQILRYDVDNDGAGSYRYAFEQTDGTKQEQQGEIVNQGREDERLVVKGSFSWVGPDGVVYTVTYTADEEGYKPEIDQGPGGALSAAALNSALG